MPTTKPDNRDQPIPVTSSTPSTNQGACRCKGVGGVHITGQPGCYN